MTVRFTTTGNAPGVLALLGLLLLAACQPEPPYGISDELTDFAEGYADAWSGGDPVAFAAFYAENGTLRINDGEPSSGRDAVEQTARDFMTAFPDMTITLVRLERDGDYVNFHWRWTGTNTGPGGTGAAVDLTGYEQWTLDDDGLILYSQGHLDEDEYQRQLDAASPAAATYPHEEEPVGSVRQVYDGALMPDLQANTFRNIDRLFATRTVRRGPDVHPLPESDAPLESLAFSVDGVEYDLYDYVSLNRISGLLVIKDGEIAYETYQLGNTEATRWMSMSVVKSITATLVGAALRDGDIDSIDDPVTRYVTALEDTAYDGVSVRQLLMMASGVDWNETYTDPASDRRRLLEAQIAQEPGGMLEVMAGLSRAAPPGTRWNYSTGETQVVAELVRAATGRNLADYLAEKIWIPYGMESEATWWLESPGGVEVGGSGLSATLRDYGRFGLFLLEGGIVNGEPVLPDGWLADATTSKRVNGEVVDYGYMFWPVPDDEDPVHDGAFEASGIFGQELYINPAEGVVIAIWSARPKPLGKTTVPDRAFYKAACEALR